jgi:hypothetical protein
MRVFRRTLGPLAASLLTLAALPSASDAATSGSTYENGQASCTVPTGWTYDFVYYQYTSLCDGIPSWNMVYYLRQPATGVWACTIPSGFHYTDLQHTDSCSGRVDVMRNMYLLAAD